MRPGTRILVVEDDPSIARLLQLELEHRGYEVCCAADGEEGLAAFERLRPDVVVLDIMLPGMDGVGVLRRLREAGHRTPVIMLTARDATGDKVHSLDRGADDYLTKPFEVEELLARMRAVLRRVEGEEVLRVGSLTVDTSAREVRRGGRAVALTAREYDLLELLARNGRRVLSREKILDRVWGEGAGVDPNVVDVYVGYLRRKLEGPGEGRLIHTVRGVGYVLRED
ncbi:two component transcriptional regulator, winged helix family [Rubrobacter xylanophilus DSM 9941]|uniref:Two component transcriptional regulator, winged helix family n=1 Tax=Rubrobacter xylanophilus (strain DSM 9941 / JCM 11954 / NBRC 16129 / PRD-1) TaxID=266117 RepID=Q1ARQ1_RUBXD|nr:response regulator transcription factor [Rubrobacter xylanophilus]ABG05927.1 two component transcriptional regulator, winged helix family [Rubrobacter xylanophilus DSM 9941]